MPKDSSNNTPKGVNEVVMADDEVIEPTLAWADIDALLDLSPDEEGALTNEEIVELIIDRQFESEGAIPNEPCKRAKELFHWWAGMDEDWMAMWREAVDRRQADDAVRAGVESAPEFLNDAEIIGTDCDEFEALMARSATFLTGKVWPDKPHKSTQAGQWKPVEMTYLQHIGGFDGTANAPAYGLSRHPVGKIKDGACIVFGSSVGGQRKANAMDTMYAIGLDIDSGASFEHVCDRVLKMGVAAIMYTSWNHEKSGLELKRDDVLKKLGLTNRDLPSGDMSIEQVQTYLREHSKNRFEETFIEAIEIAEQTEQTAEGIKIILDTPPIEKFRVVFFPDEPVSFKKLALSEGTQEAALRLWEDKITGLAQRHLGVHFDTSCTDPSRLFYTPRHAKGKDNFRSLIIKGKPLKFEDIEPMPKAEYLRNRVSGDNAFAEAGRGQEDTPGSRFRRYAATHGDRLRVSEMIRALCPDRVIGEKGDLTVVECPHKDGHSDDKDGSGFVKDADGMGRHWSWGCHRDSCQGYDRLDFIAKGVDDEWFDEEALYDDQYLYPSDDEEEDDDDGVIEDADDLGDVSEKVRKMVRDVLGDGSDEAAVRKFLKRGAQRQSLTEEDRAHVLRIAEERTAFDREQVRAIWQEFGGGDVPEVAATPRPSDSQKPIPCAKWIKDTYGFERTGTDIWTAKGKDDDDDASSTPVCQTFKVVGDAMDDTRSSGAALIVEFKNRTGEKVELALPRSEIVSESGGDIIKNLADAGFTFHGRGTHLKNNFLRLLNNISVDRHITVSPRPGWQRDRLGQVLGFLLPTDEFIRAAPEHAATTKLSPAGAFEDRKSRGTMGEWLDAADAAMWSDDPEDQRHKSSNFHWTLGLCAAFVGPIIGLADLPPRGINLSGDSSKGKSLALQLGASVWGNPAPRSSAFFPMNNTANAMEDLCTIGSETLLCLDEIGALNNKRMLSDALFNVALGSGKGRKKGRDAGLAKGAKYRPFVMLSNERTLRVEIESAGKRGDYRTGTSVRFPDISITGAADVSWAVITRLKKAHANFGHAGPAFIRYLVEAGIVGDVEALKARVSAAEVEIARTAVGDGAAVPPGTMRAAEVFGLLVVAGELACEAGLLPDRDAVRAAVLEGFRRFMASGEGEATKGEASMLDGFRSALTAAQGRGALVPAADAGDVGHQKRIGWFTDEQIILDAEAVKNVSDLDLSGTLDGLLKALGDCDALIRRTEKDRTHDRLPGEVVFSGADQKPRRLKNYRIDRAKLDW